MGMRHAAKVSAVLIDPLVYHRVQTCGKGVNRLLGIDSYFNGCSEISNTCSACCAIVGKIFFAACR